MKLSLATPEQVIFEGEVSSVVAPGNMGYMQILENHAPLITFLVQGTVKVTTQDQKLLTYSISGGVLEVAKNRIVLLADSLIT